MVYNSKHICSYQYYDSKFEDFIPKNLVVTEQVEQCEDSADLIYKSDILQVFDLIDLLNYELCHFLVFFCLHSNFIRFP